jgi:hypothetical protein
LNVQVRKTFRSGSRLFRAAAAASVLLFLSLLVFAASPALHCSIHADACDSHHHCVLTAIAHGQVDNTTASVLVAVPTPVLQDFAPFIVSVYSTTIDLLPPGRAPPSAS